MQKRKVFLIFEFHTFLSTSGLKYAICEYIPINLSLIPKLVQESKVDVTFIQVTPPNNDGFCSLGISVEAVHAIVKRQINS
ncbi:hypothetical protein [Neobacillus niacini]|uniref:hypothetical protein n=1 Tax=Neobacillus niacini TaxID=86668 RepID=UPI00358FD582